MIPQPTQDPELSPRLESLRHFNLETCPTCGQEITADKLEEIGGKIAAREREQTLAITAQLERQFAGERARADAKAKTDLELERQQSAAREARARDEAHKAAEKLVSQNQAEAEKARLELVAGWHQQLTEATSAQKSAEQTQANLQKEMQDLREASANALEAARAEAKERELEIQNKAKLTAELAAAERIAAIEHAQRESEAGLQARIDEANASRAAAEQKEAALSAQFDELRNAKEAEVAKIKADAEAEALRIREATAEAVETRFRDARAADAKAVAEADARARQAEGRVLTLTEQHATAMESTLNEQREILEKAKEEAVNAEKAKAFRENQKLSSKVNDLQRALEKKTNEELGEGAEVDVFEALKAEFPDDRISRIAKGAPGADIRHVVMLRGKECGTILYDSKNHKGWREEFVVKLKQDQIADKAQHAILSTHSFPRNRRQIHIQDGVLLSNPARVVILATIVREHMIQIHTLRLSEMERESKTVALYDFITSEQCSHLLGRIDQRADALLKMQEAEVKWHEKNWNAQGEAIRAIQKAKVNLETEIASIIGTSENDTAMSEAS